MTIKHENGFINYTIEDDEIIIDVVEVIEKRKGTGSELVKMVIEIAEEMGKNIGICAYPQDDSIELCDLVRFYEKLGFEIDYDTGNEVLMTYNV